MLNDFIALIYPHLCYACGKTLLRHEKSICNYCLYHLPRTNFHLEQDNKLERLFWGKVKIHAAAACFHFRKRGRVQQLIHHLKYKGKTEIGHTIGEFYGHVLQESPRYQDVDTVIPVPLHPDKLKKRGYNQSESFAAGLAQAMEANYLTNVLFRNTANTSQTRKSLFERWKNVEDIFTVQQASLLEGKHVLLVDDVITTGSTLEACTHALLTIPNVKVSVATIACA